ncbi:MAG TPA: AI-2E family transporter [Thermoanaerobaculia bacterium]|jgi:predicted PurR-regulated permease PerM
MLAPGGRILGPRPGCPPRKETTLISDDRFYARVFGLVVAALLAAALVSILKPFVGPILWALLLAFLLHPINAGLRKRFRGKKGHGLAALFMTVAVTLAIVLPAALLAIAFAGQAADLIRRLGGLADRYRIVRPSDIVRLPIVDRVVHWFAEHTPVTVDQVQAWIVNGLRTALEFALTNSRFVFLGALGAVVGLFLMLFILYFFFRDGDQMIGQGMALVPLDEERKRRLESHIADVTRAVVYGNVMTAIIQGALVGFAFWISPLPSPVVFGVLGAIAALIPALGTGLVLIPAAIVLAFGGHWGWSLFMLVWAVGVVGTIDNFLRPIFISGRAQISTLPVFIGAVGGVAAFGPIGLFLGPIVIALALAFIRFAEEDRASAEPGATDRDLPSPRNGSLPASR